MSGQINTSEVVYGLCLAGRQKGGSERSLCLNTGRQKGGIVCPLSGQVDRREVVYGLSGQVDRR